MIGTPTRDLVPILVLVIDYLSRSVLQVHVMDLDLVGRARRRVQWAPFSRAEFHLVIGRRDGRALLLIGLCLKRTNDVGDHLGQIQNLARENENWNKMTNG